MEDNSNRKLRSGLFDDNASADLAYQDTVKRGYRPDQINVLMSEETRKKNYGSVVAQTETGDKSMEGLAIGGALGGTVGGVIAAIVALSTTIVIPGLGLVIAGPLAAGLVGAGAGSIAGGLLGSLVGAGISEEHAKIYEHGIKKGGTVLIVDSRGDDDKLLVDDWKKNKGRDIY